MRSESSRRGAWAGFLAVAAWLFLFAHPGLRAWFTGDDVMNLQALHGLWDRSIGRIAWGLVNPLTGDYRPVGGLFYRTIWSLFGFEALPYRIACFALLLLGLSLVWLLLQRHARSWPAVMAGLLVCAYQPAESDLYYSTGTVYDLLSAVFYLLALWLAPKAPTWQIAVVTCLALQSKEMAATLPLILLLYLWLADGRIRWAPVLASGVVTALVMGVKLIAGQGLSGNELYRPRLDVLFMFEQAAKYHRDLFLLPDSVAPGWMLTFWVVLALVALRLRQRTLLFGLLFWVLTLVPVCVIPARSAFVLHLPLFGLALYAATLCSLIRQAPLRWAALAVMALAMGRSHFIHGPAAAAPLVAQGEEARSFANQMKARFPTLPPHAHLLFLDDPYPAHDWALTFVLRLLYRDPSLLIDRAKDGGPIELPPGTIVLAYRGHKLESNPPIPGALRHENVALAPAAVRPGEPYTVSAESLRATAVDVEYSTGSGGIETSGRIANWCVLDGRGSARLIAPANQPPGVIRLRRIRAAGQPWLATDASLTILPK